MMQARTIALGLVALAGTTTATLAAGSKYQRAVGMAQAEIAYGLDATNDGGWVTAGATAAATTAPENLYIVKLSPTGAIEWSRVWGTANSRDVGYCVRQTRDGGYIVAGETNLFGVGLGIVLIRLDPLGNNLWTWVYAGTPFLDFPAGISVVELFDGGFAAVGRTQPVGANAMQGLYMRVGANGFPVTQRVYQLSQTAPSQMSFADLHLDSTGNTLFVTGWADQTQQQRRELLLTRLDLAGNPLQTVTLTDGRPTITGDGIEFARTGKLYVSGRMSSAAGAAGSHLSYVDTIMTPLWSRELVQFTNGFAAVRDAEAGNGLLAGTLTNGMASMVKFDPGGNFLGGMAYGAPALGVTSGHALEIERCNRGYLLAGQTTIPLTVAGPDEYLVKTGLDLRSGCQEINYASTPRPALTRIDRQLASTFIQGFTESPFPTPVITRVLTYCFDPGCPADVDDGTGTGTPDGGVTIDDFLYYLALFDSGSLCADLDDGSGTGTPDGGVTIDDLLYFLFRFDNGC